MRGWGFVSPVGTGGTQRCASRCISDTSTRRNTTTSIGILAWYLQASTHHVQNSGPQEESEYKRRARTWKFPTCTPASRPNYYEPLSPFLVNPNMTWMSPMKTGHQCNPYQASYVDFQYALASLAVDGVTDDGILKHSADSQRRSLN